MVLKFQLLNSTLTLSKNPAVFTLHPAVAGNSQIFFLTPFSCRIGVNQEKNRTQTSIC
jgi:hypothetical protein